MAKKKKTEKTMIYVSSVAKRKKTEKTMINVPYMSIAAAIPPANHELAPQ